MFDPSHPQLFLLANLNPFKKFANFYFLCIGMMQCVPLISVSMGLPTTLPPLSFVLFIEAINDLYQDGQRKKADAVANGTRTQIFNRETQKFQESTWKDLKVGDVCKVSENEIIPADMLFLYSGAPGRPRSAFVNTKVPIIHLSNFFEIITSSVRLTSIFPIRV